MAVPKKKISITRKHRRHSTWEIDKLRKLDKVSNFVKCSNCWELKAPHRVCKKCWFYSDEQVLTIKSKSKEKIMEA